MPKRLALDALRLLRRIFGQRILCLRFLVVAGLLSTILTTLSLVVGNLVGDPLPLSPWQPRDMRHLQITPAGFPLPWWFILFMYANKLVFDTATGVVTVFILGRLASSGLAARFFYLALGLIAAAILAAGALASLFAFLILPALCMGWFGFAAYGWLVIGTVYVVLTNPVFSPMAALFLYASSALIPTTILILVLGILLISKPLLPFGRWAAKFLLERATEDAPGKLAIFTLTGSLVSAIGVLLSVVPNLLRLLQ
ncbi:MAG TPA: hypothetical protein VNE39_10630 [Planctomycetota bacterium]|nr:hypothetical protein [Planctomycetota bacterium]